MKITQSKKLFSLIVLFGLLATMVSSLDANNNRHRRRNHNRKAGTAAAVIGGAAVGGAIAGGVGKAAWVPLGLGVGAIAGYALIKAIRNANNNNGRNQNMPPEQPETVQRRHIKTPEQ